MRTMAARDDGRMAAARLFANQPERVAAAWRRVRYAQTKKNQTHLPMNLLDSVIEPFVREIGFQLAGKAGKAWTRTTGVLRVSPERGPRGLYEEFAVLRKCLTDALDVVGASADVRAKVSACVDEAVDSSIAHLVQLGAEAAEAPAVPFGGLVVEYFERPAAVTKNVIANRPGSEQSLH